MKQGLVNILICSSKLYSVACIKTCPEQISSKCVYREEERGFVGIRHKMGRRYLFTEFHWDIGPPYGTANPLEAICECPVERLDEYFRLDSEPGIEPNTELFDWIDEQGKQLGITPESC